MENIFLSTTLVLSVSLSVSFSFLSPYFSFILFQPLGQYIDEMTGCSDFGGETEGDAESNAIEVVIDRELVIKSYVYSDLV